MLRRLAEYLQSPDGKLDECAGIAIVGMIHYFVFTDWMVFAKGSFDPIQWATGFSIAFGVVTLGLGVKAKLGG